MSVAHAGAAGVTIRWTPNVPSPEYYRVYLREGDRSDADRRLVWQGQDPACTIDGLAEATEYGVVVRAFANGMESGDSDEIYFITAVTAAAPAAVPVRDEDEDGMPDDWEMQYGLDLMGDDADGDADADGIANRDEYLAGLAPDDPGVGLSPNTPQPLAAASETVAGTAPLLEIAEYGDPEGDAHIATQWQIFDTAAGACLLDIISDRALDQLPVPLLVLAGDTVYQWRTRVFDSGGKASAWSPMLAFTTAAADNDGNGNGIPDDQEGGEIGAATHAVAQVPTTPTPVQVSTDAPHFVADVAGATLVDPAIFEVDETTPRNLPEQMVAYRLVLDQPGQTAAVSIRLSGPAPSNGTWLRYDTGSGWQDYSNYADFSADRRSVTVRVKDGGHGDADGVANGVIVDPSGLAVFEAQAPVADAPATDSAATGGAALDGLSPETAGGGGGGCFIATLF